VGGFRIIVLLSANGIHDGKNPDKANGSPRGLEVGCVMIGQWTEDCRFLYRVVSSPASWKVREAESWGADLERCWIDI